MYTDFPLPLGITHVEMDMDFFRELHTMQEMCFLTPWNLFSGVGENGIEDIKTQPFFSSIDWEVCFKVFCLECMFQLISPAAFL